jgi:hypothetical protein
MSKITRCDEDGVLYIVQSFEFIGNIRSVKAKMINGYDFLVSYEEFNFDVTHRENKDLLRRFLEEYAKNVIKYIADKDHGESEDYV